MATGTLYDSPFLLSDEDIVGRGVTKANAAAFRQCYYQMAFSIESWYEKVTPEITFATEFVPLSYPMGAALLAKNRATRFSEGAMTSKQNEYIEELCSWMDEKIEKLGGKAFVKLGSRSPKDVVVDCDGDDFGVKKLVQEELKRLNVRNEHTETLAFIRGSSRAMMVTNGKEALDLLLRSHRVASDISRWMDFPEKEFRLQICLREWVDEVVRHPECEYRGFVHNGQLNALSQYISFVVVPELQEKKEEIQASIVEFFERIRPMLPHPSFVVDFYVKEDGSVLLIELNPFHSLAGACLFSWSKDRELFLKGPLEFRLTQNVEISPLDYLSSYWKEQVHASPSSWKWLGVGTMLSSAALLGWFRWRP